MLTERLKKTISDIEEILESIDTDAQFYGTQDHVSVAVDDWISFILSKSDVYGITAMSAVWYENNVCSVNFSYEETLPSTGTLMTGHYNASHKFTCFYEKKDSYEDAYDRAMGVL